MRGTSRRGSGRSWILMLALAGCAHGMRGGPPLPAFDGPGQLLIVIEREDARELFVLEAAGARRVPGVQPVEARWIDARSLLVIERVAAAEAFHLPRTQLRVIDRVGRRLAPIGSPGRHYDAEPSPDGAWLAVGAETAGIGDSDLEIWSLSAPYERIATRHQSLEEARWRPDGRALVASVLMPDPEEDDDTGGGMLGTSFSWPRLHRLRRDLGDPTLLWDGDDGQSLAPGGSLALWWDEGGVFARQREGLVRCDPTRGGCSRIFSPGDARRIVDGRRVGADEAWLLSVEASDAFDRREPDEILRVDLRDGRLRSRWRAPEGSFVSEIDWIDTP